MSEMDWLDAASSTGEYTLPIGFTDRKGEVHTGVTLREMNGADEEILAGKGSAVSKMHRLIASCVKTIGDNKPSLSMIQSLTGVDIVFLLIAIRRQSFGDKFNTRECCPKCDLEQHFSIGIDNLEVENADCPLTSTGRLPKTDVPFSWRVVTGRDDFWASKLTEKLKSSPTIQLMVPLIDINGINMKPSLKDKDGLKRALTVLEQIPVADRLHIRALVTKHSPRIDTKVEFVCSDESCEHEWEAELPITDPGFFFPPATLES